MKPADRSRAVVEAEHVKGSARAVLFVLAHYADQSSLEAWPSLESIAAGSGLHMNTVRRGLHDLCALGMIEPVTQSAGRYSNRYRLNLVNPTAPVGLNPPPPVGMNPTREVPNPTTQVGNPTAVVPEQVEEQVYEQVRESRARRRRAQPPRQSCQLLSPPPAIEKISPEEWRVLAGLRPEFERSWLEEVVRRALRHYRDEGVRSRNWLGKIGDWVTRERESDPAKKNNGARRDKSDRTFTIGGETITVLPNRHGERDNEHVMIARRFGIATLGLERSALEAKLLGALRRLAAGGHGEQHAREPVAGDANSTVGCVDLRVLLGNAPAPIAPAAPPPPAAASDRSAAAPVKNNGTPPAASSFTIAGQLIVIHANPHGAFDAEHREIATQFGIRAEGLSRAQLATKLISVLARRRADEENAGGAH